MLTREIELHPKQYQAFNFSTQYCAAIAGVRGGKTYVGSLWAGNKIATSKGHGLIVGPTHKMLQQATLPTFFQLFPEYRKFYKEQKSVLEFPDKSLPDGIRNVYIRSMEDPLSAEGITADWAWGDEAGLYKSLAWTVLRSRTSLAQGQVFLTTTPYNMGWLFREFYLPWKEGQDKDLTVVTWASVDNPYFSQEFAEKEKKRLRIEEYNRRYLGEFSKMEGLVYNLHQWHIIKPKDLRAEITIGGIDWGYTNPAALTVVKYADGQWFVVDEWYQTGKTTRDIIEAAQALQNKWGVNRWYADSANPEKILEASQSTGLKVIPYDKGRDALTAGISYIQQEINENRFFVFDTNKHSLSEFDEYHYPELDSARQTTMDVPIPESNHLMDAIRYAIHGYQPARRFPVQVKVTSFGDALKNMLQRDVGRKELNTTSYE